MLYISAIMTDPDKKKPETFADLVKEAEKKSESPKNKQQVEERRGYLAGKIRSFSKVPENTQKFLAKGRLEILQAKREYKLAKDRIKNAKTAGFSAKEKEDYNRSQEIKAKKAKERHAKISKVYSKTLSKTGSGISSGLSFLANVGGLRSPIRYRKIRRR